MEEKIDKALKMVGMSDYKNTAPINLSGGQKQRVALAGILALMPKIIILDEATSMLDPLARQEILSLLRRLKNEYNLSIISITHDLKEIELADKIVVLNDSQVVKQGTPAEILKDKELAKAAITVKKLHYTYPNSTNEALHNVSLTIHEQEFVAIIGQTGSGKSTLVSLIDGLIKPSSGELNVAGLEINATTKAEYLSKIHHQVGFVFQFPEQQLFAETVAEDIAFGPHNLGWSAKRIEKAVDEALKMVDLPLELKSHSPFALSGGQMRRVAIASVLAMDPKILILDEPTAGLDTQATNELNKKRTTIIMVTHQMEQVAYYANHVIAMSNGQVVADTTPQQLFNDAQRLKKLSLTLPVSVEVAQFLSKDGITLKNTEPLTLDALADEIAEAMRRKENE